MSSVFLHRQLCRNTGPSEGLGRETGGHVAERMIDVNGVQICTEPFGHPAKPPILLVMGLGGSMLWWDEQLCRMLAAGGRFVVRYDHRDTGRSMTYDPGHPPYNGADLVTDAAGVLDAYGLAAAHIVGVSAGGALAQALALDFADRVLSLTLISTSAVTPVDGGLPSPTDEFGRFVATAEVDWSDSESVVEYLVGYSRVLNGDQRAFDEAACREFVRRDIARTRTVASLQNHDAIAGGDPSREPLSAIEVPTLVIHGTADPMFPLRHGEALAAQIPGATLLALDGAGHGVDRRDWGTIAAAVVEQTRGGRTGRSPNRSETPTDPCGTHRDRAATQSPTPRIWGTDDEVIKEDTSGS